MRRILPYILLAVMWGCTNTTFVSAVPSYPVQLTINTNQGMYVNFVPTNLYAYTIVNKSGYHYNNQTLPITMSDYYGYAGVLVYICSDGSYAAYDLCCPKCVKKDQPVEVDGIFAICPGCGEEYDLSFGLGVPQRGIARESLKRYNTSVNSGTIRVY